MLAPGTSCALPIVVLAAITCCRLAFVVPTHADPQAGHPQRPLPSAPKADASFESEGRLETTQTQRGDAFSLGFGLVLGLALALCPAAPALADPNLANGQSVFSANCAACHAGGNNAVVPDKKLKKEALELYGMLDVERIQYQVTNGKNAMPAFGERLVQSDIEDVATYVLSQANTGWAS